MGSVNFMAGLVNVNVKNAHTTETIHAKSVLKIFLTAGSANRLIKEAPRRHVSLVVVQPKTNFDAIDILPAMTRIPTALNTSCLMRSHFGGFLLR